ncbi:sulfatase [Candidatus Woesearchaeota archaeon]|nr:sulfatase [Candidatus Woesearchaeota archaeon]
MEIKPIANVKLALFSGMIIGSLHGTIDVLIRIMARSFEWFELYQTLLMSLIIFILIFLIVSILIELLRVFGIKIIKKAVSVFYFSTAVAILLLFYVSIFVNNFLLSNFGFWNNLEFNLITIIIVIIIYIFLLSNGNLIFNFMLLINNKAKNLIRNYIFLVTFFIISSSLIDLYTLNHVISFKSNIQSEVYPNVVILLVDALRPDHLLYAPNINKLASNSVMFDNAISSSSLSLLSQSSIFTGRYPSHHGAVLKRQILNQKELTLAEILKENGYNTAGFIGGVYTKAKYGMGQGFITYKDRLDFFEYVHTFDKFSLRAVLVTFFPISKSLLRQDGESKAEDVNKQVFRWLENNKEHPFFMFVDYIDPHTPYGTEEEFKKNYPNNIINLIKLYDTEISYVDHNLGKLLDKLEELGIKNNTIIIILADHGEEFYEHGYLGHGNTLYQEAIHVPLIISYQKELKAQKIQKRVETIDILPTILDLIRIEAPQNIDGISLFPMMKNEGNYTKEYALSELYGRAGIDETEEQIAILYENWKLITVKPDIEKIPSGLYNLKTDPKEQINLYDVYTEKRDFLRKYIINIKRNT